MQDGALASRFLVGALATWRVTHLLVEEDGPADVVVRLRRRAGDGWIGQAMDCFYCLSIWMAAPVAAAVARRPQAQEDATPRFGDTDPRLSGRADHERAASTPR